MVEVSATNIQLHSMGDLRVVTADLTSVGNAETFTVPHLRKIVHWTFSCTTDDETGGTVSGNVITFANGAAIEGSIAVLGW